MNPPPPLPAANQRAEQVVSTDGNRCSETTGDRLATATAAGITYAEQTARLLAANKDAVWSGSLSHKFLCKLFVNAPLVSA